MKTFRLIPTVILITSLTSSSTLTGAPAESGAESALAYLGRELETTAKHLFRTGEDTDDVYTEISWKSVADTFPEKFDLRTRGTVTPVKNQSPWNTCWSFADIAASETSILNALGMTTEQYTDIKQRYGIGYLVPCPDAAGILPDEAKFHQLSDHRSCLRDTMGTVIRNHLKSNRMFTASDVPKGVVPYVLFSAVS